jgi:DNA (cytosine-5)-methyltransferase 1
MNVLDLFSGIGGFSLGLERAGMRTVAFCEIDPYCRAVLAKHWPGVPCFDDVRKLTAADITEPVDVICGGFPCQDISVAGKGAGLAGERSGLWREYARLIGEIRPRYVIVENVAALLGRGLSTVLGDLSEIGYDAEWHVISAADVGAPHRRERVWIVAYPVSGGCGEEWFGRGLQEISGEWANQRSAVKKSSQMADTAQLQRNGCAIHAGGHSQSGDEVLESGVSSSVDISSDANIQRLEGQRQIASGISQELHNLGNYSWWRIEPDVGRVAYGVPARVDRLKGLGNAVVPQIPEMIGRAIMEASHATA